MDQKVTNASEKIKGAGNEPNVANTVPSKGGMQEAIFPLGQLKQY